PALRRRALSLHDALPIFAERRTLNEPPPIRQLLRGRLLEEQATVTLQGGAEGVESRPTLRPHRHLNLLREHAVRLGDGLTAMNLVDVPLRVLGDVTDPGPVQHLRVSHTP